MVLQPSSRMSSFERCRVCSGCPGWIRAVLCLLKDADSESYLVYKITVKLYHMQTTEREIWVLICMSEST